MHVHMYMPHDMYMYTFMCSYMYMYMYMYIYVYIYIYIYECVYIYTHTNIQLSLHGSTSFIHTVATVMQTLVHDVTRIHIHARVEATVMQCVSATVMQTLARDMSLPSGRRGGLETCDIKCINVTESRHHLHTYCGHTHAHTGARCESTPSGRRGELERRIIY